MPTAFDLMAAAFDSIAAVFDTNTAALNQMPQNKFIPQHLLFALHIGRRRGRPQQDRGWAATEQRRAERQTQKKLARGNQKRLRREESREYLLLDYDLIE